MFRCVSTDHKAYECKYKTYTCAYCKKVGHLQSNCFVKKKNKENPKKQNNVNLSDDNDKVTLYNGSSHSAPYKTSIIIDGKPVSIEIDTGAAVTIMSKVFNDHYLCSKVPKVKQSEEMLSTYTGEKIPIYGTVDVCVSVKGKSTELPLTIVSGSGPALLGRNWLNSINLDWPMINNIANEKYTHLLKKYSQVFDLTNTKPVKGIEAKIHVPSDAKPCYYEPRDIPDAITELINNEIDRLLAECIIVSVTHSDWAAPVVPVVKADKKLRVCGVYTITVNKCTTNDSYPLPKIEDLYAKLSGGKIFTSID